MHLHRRPRAVRRARHRLGARPGGRVRRRALAAGRLHRGAGRGGPGRDHVRRLPRAQRRQDLLQHHAPRPRGDRHPARARHAGRRASRSGATGRPTRATTSSGSTATACSRTRRCGSTSRGSTRTSSASSAAGTRCRSGSSRTACPTATRPRRPTAPTRTCSARPTRPRASNASTSRSRSSSRSWASSTGTPTVEIVPEDVTVEFRQGRPVAINGTPFDERRRRDPGGERHRRPPRARHVRPDREPDHRGQEPRHLRGPRNGAAVRRLRAPRQRDPQRGHHRRPTTRRAAASAGCSTRAGGSTRSR